jgi:two-component system OmpR family response regulator
MSFFGTADSATFLPLGRRNATLTETRRRILVVEDDPETGSQLVDFLRARGYEVDLASNSNDGLRLGSSRCYAVMTIDRMLPGMDGLSIVRKLRESGNDMPALIVSALGEVDDRVRGLRSGGDDYLVKPFAFVELLARIEALARRSTTVAKETLLRVGDLELDLVARTANRAGKGIALLPREFQVLEYLVRNAGQVVPRAMLLQHVWNLNFDPTTNIIDVYVSRVRRKVDNHHSYPLIHTVRGVGFCLRAHC